MKITPLTDSWAQRSFVICFNDLEVLQSIALRLAGRLTQQAQAAVESG